MHYNARVIHDLPRPPQMPYTHGFATLQVGVMSFSDSLRLYLFYKYLPTYKANMITGNMHSLL